MRSDVGPPLFFDAFSVVEVLYDVVMVLNET